MKITSNWLACTMLAVAGLLSASAATASAAEVTAAAAATLCGPLYQGSGGTEPLAPCQWDMKVIKSIAANAKATGKGVKVGIIDGGLDFNHPDLAGAIDVGLSCSFIYSTTPTADPSEVANGDCSNKAAVQDLEGHGTHVATTIAGRVNGIGIAGVAPEATVVGLKVCTVEGFCFADSVAAALRYAGDKRLDVVNLSLFADPYLYYCSNDAGQRAMIKQIQNAAAYAQQRGVVIVAAAGNESQDLDHTTVDDISPDWPPDAAIERTIHNNCRVAPAEIPGVITVSASGVNQLASYSSVGSPVDVTAPGGDGLQMPSTAFGRGRILAGWSGSDITGSWEAFAAANPTRAVTDGGGRYVWISGTSMASPHVAGVAALVKQLHPNMAPGTVAAWIRAYATKLSCPADWPADDPRRCYGGTGQTSFYGAGMVNAKATAH